MYSSSSSQNKNDFKPYDQIIIPFDLDLLEIKRNELIKKYEQNLYLLGNIFSISNTDTVPSNDIKEVSPSSEYEEDEDFTKLFSYKDIIDDNEEIDQDEKLNSMIRRLESNNKSSTNEKLQSCLNQLKVVYEEFQNEEKLLKDHKSKMELQFKEYENIISKLKNTKNVENENYFSNLETRADNIGILSDTYKQCHNYETNNQINLNKDIPFTDQDDKMLIEQL
jgi:hypothetical protein